MRALAIIGAAAVAGPALAAAPADVARYADLRDALGAPRLADTSCVVTSLAAQKGAPAVSDLIAITEAALTEGRDHREATLAFVSRHGDAWYGIVAGCARGAL